MLVLNVGRREYKYPQDVTNEENLDKQSEESNTGVEHPVIISLLPCLGVQANYQQSKMLVS